MKICFITHYAELYGANKSLLDTLDTLIEQDYFTEKDLHIIVPFTGTFSKELQKRNLHFSATPFEADWYDPKNIKAVLATKRRIRKRRVEKEIIIDLIRQFNPDIIHTNSSVTLVGALAAERLNLPHFWHVREDIINHYRRKFDSSIATYNYMRNAAKVIATSRYIKEMLESNGVQNVEVLYNIITSKYSKQKKEMESNTTFGVVGLIHKKKNQEFIATAMIPFLEKNQDAKLCFYGNGDIRIVNSIKSIIATHPRIQNQVSLEGYIEDSNEIYSSMDVLINMSEYEAFGRVNLEANANGIPVIGLKSGATTELIENGRTGILIDKSEKQLRAALEVLLNLETRNQMSENAIQYFQKFNDPKEYALRLMTLYRDAVSA